LGAVMSVALALALDYFDPSFRTPGEVLSELNIPVLAAVPHRAAGGFESSYGNGEPVAAYSAPVPTQQQ